MCKPEEAEEDSRVVREMKDAHNHRLRLAERAKQRGIKPTARPFVTTVPTVRKWLRRFQQSGRVPGSLPQRLRGTRWV